VLSVLTAAAATQSIVYGGILLLVFGLGRVIPLFFAALSAELVKRIEAVSRYIPRLEKAFGVVFVLLGIYYLSQAWIFIQAVFTISSRTSSVMVKSPLDG
jgi:cytochrome c-type biogenesis protein